MAIRAGSVAMRSDVRTLEDVRLEAWQDEVRPALGITQEIIKAPQVATGPRDHGVAAAGGGYHPSARGSVKQKVEPRPAPSDSTQIRPPWTSMIRFTRARPMPVPS